MADEMNSSTLSEADLAAINAVLQDLKAKARDASQKGNASLLAVYTDLVKVVSPRVVRLHARVERENMAAMRKKHQALKPKRPTRTNS